MKSLTIILECGHEEVIPTDMYRITAIAANKIFDNMKEKGTFCLKCNKVVNPIEISNKRR